MQHPIFWKNFPSIVLQFRAVKLGLFLAIE